MTTRYSTLPIVSMLLKIMGFVVLLLGLITAVYYFISGQTSPFNQLWYLMYIPSPGSTRPPFPTELELGFIGGHVIPAIISAVVGFVGCLLLVALGEIIHVVMDIEENTRRAASQIGSGGDVSPAPRF